MRKFKLLVILTVVPLLPRFGLAQQHDTTGGIPAGAYVPIFSKTPARMMEPAVGAWVWASGNQEWKGKTVLVTGAHPDDDSHAYGALSRLQENGNLIYVLIIATGNVGTKDPDMTRNRLSQIRRGGGREAARAGHS